jgi:hypothetical protein
MYVNLTKKRSGLAYRPGAQAGARAILPGASTAAVACVLLQLAFNELAVARVKYVSRSLHPSSQHTIQTSLNPRPQLNTGPPLEPAIPFLKRVLTGLGLREVSDEEYLATMKKRRDVYVKQIRKLERQIDEERKMGGSSGDSSD